MQKITEAEKEEYKSLLKQLSFFRSFYIAEYRLSYKRGKNNALYYYLTLSPITLSKDNEHIFITYHAIKRRYGLYKSIYNYIEGYLMQFINSGYYKKHIELLAY